MTERTCGDHDCVSTLIHMLDSLGRNYNITLIVVAVAVLALGVVFVMTFSRSRMRRRTRSVARTVGLALPADTFALERRVMYRMRAATGGGALGGLITLGLSLWFSPRSASGETVAWILFAAGSIAAGGALGVGLVATLRRPRRPEGTRFARARAVTLADYLIGLERVGARVVVALAVTVTLTSTALSNAWGFEPLMPSVLSVAMVALSVIALVGFEILARRIIARPQPAGSPEELAWDDALRAWDARDLVTTPIVFGGWALFLIFSELSSTPLDNGFAQTMRMFFSVTFLIFAVALLVTAIVSLAVNPQQHYLRRLWPELAGGRS